jgi:hypothetical protein
MPQVLLAMKKMVSVVVEELYRYAPRSEGERQRGRDVPFNIKL